jgi:hypothetical protein
MNQPFLVYVFAFFGTFAAVFLKGFQYKNVNANMYGKTFITSYLMSFVDVLLIGLVARATWDIAFASGSGAAFGMVSAMWLHNKFFRRT